MNAEKAGAFFCPAHAKDLHLTSRDGGNVLNRRERFRPCRQRRKQTRRFLLLQNLHSTHPCVSKTSKMGGLFVAGCLIWI